MASIEIIEVSQGGMHSDALFAGWIEAPIPETRSETYVIAVSGWILGRESPTVAIELQYEGMILRIAPVTIVRPDIATGYPEYPNRQHATISGFATAIGTLGLTPAFTVHVVAVLADGRRVLWGRICGRHDPIRSDFVPTLHPIMVTALGRTGTTLLMQLLADHPAIVILLAKSETAENITAAWSNHGSFATSVHSSDDFASSIGSGPEPISREAIRRSRTMAPSTGKTSPTSSAPKRHPRRRG